MLFESPPRERTAPHPELARLSREVVQLYARSFGRGPTKSRSHLSHDFGLCILEEVFTRPERTLVAVGHGKQVIENRRCLHEAIEPELRRIVEECVERPVRLCVGQIDTEANLAIEFFSFAAADA